MVNDLLKVVLLAEVHGGLLSESVAEELFGKSVVSSFRKKYPEVMFKGGFIGKGSRRIAVQRNAMAKRKIECSRKLFGYLSWVPWIRFAGVTGSTSYDNPRAEDDIDVFLVVQHNRLWLSRLAEQLVFRILGVRLSFGDRDQSDRICINYYLSEQNIKITPEQKDFFTALEIIMMKPVFREDFLSFVYMQNKWMGEYFPFVMNKQRKTSEKKKQRIDNSYYWYFIFGDILDRFAQLLQLFYMKIMGHTCQKGEIIEQNEVRFFGSKDWDKRKKELDRKLQLYDL